MVGGEAAQNEVNPDTANIAVVDPEPVKTLLFSVRPSRTTAVGQGPNHTKVMATSLQRRQLLRWVWTWFRRL